MTDLPRPGASYLGGGRCRFSVWVPEQRSVGVVLLGTGDGGATRVVSLEPLTFGHHAGTVENVVPGQRYKIRIGGADFPDLASRSQPDGVHRASEIIDPAYAWEDREWLGIPLRDYVLYELHVGTFTLRGTFDGVAEHLGGLKELGVTALELMPVAQFPGQRNWGYDGVYPYPAQDSYGGIDGLRRLVDACHRSGLAGVLDVVYNHLGPEGNYADSFGPYSTDRYNIPWGAALAVETGRNIHLIPESSDNDPRLVRERDHGGYGMHAVWADDLHHSLHVLLTGERDGYYADYGALDQLAKCHEQGFAYTGEYSGYRGRRQGASALGEPAERFVVCVQNHGQIGNRPSGNRLMRGESWPQAHICCLPSCRCCSWVKSMAKPRLSRISSATPMKILYARSGRVGSESSACGCRRRASRPRGLRNLRVGEVGSWVGARRRSPNDACLLRSAATHA